MSLLFNFGLQIAFSAAMSSFDTIYKKLASSLENGAHAHESKFDPSRHIAPAVAHELNNILTIIQGYADRLLLKHETNSTIEPHLKLISEAARRATTIVRSAAPPHDGGNAAARPIPQPPSV